MLYRTHGDLTLSEVGVGCYALSGVYGHKDIAEYRRMLERAYALGVTFYDTAAAYGEAERILGEQVRPYRDQILIATKIAIEPGFRRDLSAGYVKTACEDSLRRLQTDVIDLYQVHFDDPNTSVEETVGALEALVEEGKIRHYGVGHLPKDRIVAYLEQGRVFSVLMELSAATREARSTLLPLCLEYGVGAIAFSVTGRGLLTGTLGPETQFGKDDIRSLDPLFQRERYRSGLRVADQLGQLAARHGRSPVQAAIAWVLAQPGIVCALTGPSSVAHLEENVQASGWQLTSEELAELEAFFVKEEAWLHKEQARSVVRILERPLPRELDKALESLVYAVETALLLGRLEEAEVPQEFVELLVSRHSLDTEAWPKLQRLQEELRGRLLSCTGLSSDEAAF